MMGSRGVSPTYGGRAQPAFPSKFQQLPGISSPTHSEQNALVAMGSLRNSYDNNNGYGGDSEDRMRQIETRVNVAEKSNRALLEEVVRLQSELKGTIRRNEDIIREERHSRGQIENSLRGANDLIGQLSMRLQRTEDRLTEEKSAVNALISHQKSVEQSVVGSQQEILSRRDLQHTKIQELRVELDDTVRSKEQLEKSTYTMMDEIRQLKAKVENQASDFTNIALDLRSKSHRLEDQTRHVRLETLRKQGETQSQTEQHTTQLRSQVEARLSELRDAVVELRHGADQEQQERRMEEQQLQVKLSDLQAAITEQTRKREETMHSFDTLQREKEHSAEHERIKLQTKIGEIAEELSKKLLQKEIKLRQESQEKFGTLETMLMSEQMARQRFENDQRDDTERRWEALKHLSEDEMNSIREAFKMEKKKNQETFHRLNEAVLLTENQVDAMTKSNDKILGAEIKSRKTHQKETLSRIADLNDKLSVATSTLQQAIGGMQSRMEDESKKVKHELKARMDDQTQSDTRTLADMDVRVSSMQRKVNSMEDDMDARLKQSQMDNAQALRDKVQAVQQWQDITQQSIREMQAQIRDVPHDIAKVSDQQRSLHKEIDLRVTAETDSRKRDVDNARKEIDRLARRQDDSGGASRNDVESARLVEECQQSIRKLAESIQTVKTVLGMKIQSEQKLRESTTVSIQEQIDELQRICDKLEEQKPDGGAKDEPNDEPKDEPSDNVPSW